MKVGIITFHFVHNQGAVLQCFALQTMLKKLGHDVRVINYRPRYHLSRYAAKKNPFVLASNSWKKNSKQSVGNRAYRSIRSFLRGVKTYIKPADKLREENFNRFLEKHIVQTDAFMSLASLKKNAPKFDAYISGSDQLWNPELLDSKLDSAYFLDFGDDAVNRITYAVSLKQQYSEEEKKEINRLCERINHLSIREHNEDLDELNRPYTVCIDPTLLLEQSDYAELESQESEKEPYVFVYGFESSDEIRKAVAEVSNTLGVRVINGSPDKIKLDGEVVNAKNYAPDQFLKYIKNAEYVVTNSFHGTAFSIIYGKQFVTIPHTTRGRRMIELLEKLDLSDRIWQNEGFAIDSAINYEVANEKLTKLRAEALGYLTNALEQ